ncbi:MAG: hypothetical protein ACXAC5_04370 [Promethearchaeota archaeon]|jgi:hypothetical protein
MKKIEWPEDGKAMCFEALSDSVREVVRHCYTLSRKNKKKDVDWKGPSLPRCMQATCLSFEDNLKAESLEYQLHDQGRDAMEVIIGIAIQLGIEQGRRALKEEVLKEVKYMEMYLVGLSAEYRKIEDKLKKL